MSSRCCKDRSDSGWRGRQPLTITHKYYFSVSAFVSVMVLVMVGSLSSVVFSQGAFIYRGKNGH